MVLTYLLVIAAGAALYLVPGWAALRWLWRGPRLSLADQFALALGIGIALPPVLIELSYLIGLKWSTWTAVAYLLAALLALVVAAAVRKPAAEPAADRWGRYGFWGLLALTLTAAAVRLYAVRDLPVGLWGDSVHHTIMAQLIVDNGGLFTSWQPYAELTTFTYHFGFHANVALLHWLTGIPVEKALMYSGQILNAAALPMAYVLISQLVLRGRSEDGRRRALAATAGLWAAALVGFYSTLPAWLFNWGRYTQQLGQALLVVVLVCWINALEQSDETRRPAGWLSAAALAALVTAGLMLTHYIVMIFAALMLAVYIAALIALRPTARAAGWVVGIAALVTAASVALTLPWLQNTLSGYLVRNAGDFVSGQVAADRVASYASLGMVTPFFLKGPLLVLAGLGLWAALAGRAWRVAMLAVWSALIVLTVVPQALGLPGAGVVDMTTGYMALYVTVGPLAGYAAGRAQTWLSAQLARRSGSARLALVPTAAGSLAIAGLAVFGVSWQNTSADLNYQLLTDADWRAMQWIKAETPSDAKFLVNAFPSYGGTLVAGSDGGWWLKYLTGRETNLPPLTYGNEKGPSLEWTLGVNGFAEAVRQKPMADLSPTRIDPASPAVLKLLRDKGFTHVYVGARLNPPAARADAIDPSGMRASPDFKPVYSQDGVEIFEIAR